jgi:hypothetical protein
MAGVLFHFLNDAAFRETVKTEHRTISALFNEYLAGLRRVYGREIK